MTENETDEDSKVVLRVKKCNCVIPCISDFDDKTSFYAKHSFRILQSQCSQETFYEKRLNENHSQQNCNSFGQ